MQRLPLSRVFLGLDFSVEQDLSPSVDIERVGSAEPKIDSNYLGKSYGLRRIARPF